MDVDAKNVENCEEDDEYEEEELLVEMKFEGGNLHEPLLSGPGVHFKLIGATTAKPVLQLGEQMFAGQYVDTMGTTVIFEEDDSRPYFDPVFSSNPENPLRYYASTRKRLVMSRIFIKEKKKEGGEAQDGDQKQQGKDGQGKEVKQELSPTEDEKSGPDEEERMDSDVADDDDWETDKET